MGWLSDRVAAIPGTRRNAQDLGAVALAPVTGGASLLASPSVQEIPSNIQEAISGPPPPVPIPPNIGAQTASNIQTADATGRINNPNLVNQYGTTTFTEPTTPGGRSTMTSTLSPEQQRLFNTQQTNQQSMGTIAGQGINNLSGTIGQKFDISGAPTVGNAEGTRQKVIDAMMSRSDQKLQQAAEQQDSDLIASGIRPGTEAWDRAKTQQGQNRNDMLSQAEIAGGDAAAQSFAMDSTNRQNEIKNLLTQRQLPLNEVNAFLGGSQVSNPFAGQGYQGGATVQGTDVNAGTNMLNQFNQDVYNQKTGTRNALIGAGATLGAAALSDRRLKTDIERIGTHKLGIGLYRWRYITNPPEYLKDMANWGTYAFGVMAQELIDVMPSAVITLPNGYMAVDYSMIGD